jgi:hypothetical protein
MFTALFSRRSVSILVIPLITACGSPSADTDAAQTSADTSADPGTSTSTAAPTTTAGTDAPTTTAGTDAPQTTTTGTTTAAGADCGNGMLDAGEACDGAELGGQTCADVNPSYIGGALACGAGCTFDESGCMLAPDAALVTLNELTSESLLTGPMAMMGDAIELYNAGMKGADMSGWKLSDDQTFPVDKTYVFPAGSTLGPGEFRVLYALDTMTLMGDFPFGINSKGADTLILADANGDVVDTVMVDGPKAAVSLCRLPDGVGAWAQCEQTFGAKNKLAATACGNEKIEDLETCDGPDLGGATCMSLDLGYTGGTLGCTGKCRFDYKQCTTNSKLVLNELESVTDDIEIYNGGAATVDLSGWVLTDDRVDKLYDPAADANKLVFPPGTTLPSKAFLVVPVGLAAGQHPFGLAGSGDTVTLFSLTGPIIIDSVTYGTDEALVSYCRKPNGPGGDWSPDCPPTMGTAN